MAPALPRSTSATPANPAGPAPAKPVLFGKYLLIEELGRGGMAEVWKAKRIGPAGFERMLVIKRILPLFAREPHFVEMFCHEARLSARLNHANIVQVFELGDVAGEYYLAMEYVRGHNLASVLAARLPPLGLSVHVVREMCRGLEYAHALKAENGEPLRIIHRDVSPANVMLGFDGAVRLVDFGIAKALALAEENTTHGGGGALKGKLSYMSPEQADGRAVDHRADIFAVGVVLYEALTGQRLFRRATELQTIAAVREARVDPPSKVNPEVPPELDRICLKALARNPEHRYQRCEEMGADLAPLAHELAWGAQRLAGLLKEIFPAEESSPALEAITHDAAPGRPFPRSPRTQWGRWVLAGCGVGLAGGIALFAVQRNSSEEVAPRRPVATLLAPQSRPVAPLPASIPTSEDVTVTVLARPATATAEVFVAGETTARGSTPLTLHFPRGATSVKVVLKAKGRAPVDLDVVPDEDVRLEVVFGDASPVTAAAPPVQKPPVAKHREKTEFTYEELMEDDDKPSKPAQPQPDPSAGAPPRPAAPPRPEPREDPPAVAPTSLPDKLPDKQ